MFRSFVTALFLSGFVIGDASALNCGEGSSPMSVEGVEGVFCTSGDSACSGDNSNGSCPTAQNGLVWGSYCGVVQSGVYGCKKYDGPNGIKGESTYQCAGNPVGGTPVSVVGQGTFCASQPVCAGSTQGNCPDVQDGLSKASTCAIIETGVYGCVMQPCPDGKYAVTVEYWSDRRHKVFCLDTSNVCSPTSGFAGACPQKNDGLMYGSYCMNGLCYEYP